MLQIGAKRFGFSGKLDSEARALAALRRAGATPLTVQVEVGSGSGAGVVTGEVTDGSWIATAVGYLAPFSSRSWHSPVAGSYTLILPGQDGAPGSTAGDGYAAVRATSGGVVSVAGVLADGTRFTQAAALSSAGFWPMFVPNSAGQGLLTGWLGFQSGSSSSPDGTLTWIKPQASTSIYESAGLTNITQTIGSSYLLSKSATGLPWESTPFEAVFSGGDLATGFTNSCVMLNPSHAVSQGISGFTMNFSRTTGLFRGKVVDPATGQQLNFGGAVLQNVGSGFGYVLLPNRSGRIVLNP